MDERHRITSELRTFGEARLNAGAYRECSHRFSLYTCGGCRGVTTRVVVERLPGDKQGDFRGRVVTTCAVCGTVGAAHAVQTTDDPTSSEPFVCRCGFDVVCVGTCERWEDWGFFDEGTIVARCAACGLVEALADTD